MLYQLRPYPCRRGVRNLLKKGDQALRVRRASYLTCNDRDRRNHRQDIELKFYVDEIKFSIDVRKSFLESLKDIYKALSMISLLQQRNEQARANAVRALDAISSIYRLNSAGSEDSVVKQYNALFDNFNNTMLDRFGGRDYSAVFQKYIQA